MLENKKEQTKCKSECSIKSPDEVLNKEVKKAIKKCAKKEYGFSKAFNWFVIGFCTCTMIVEFIQLFK